MGIQDYTSSTNTTFMFPPPPSSSQIPLIFHQPSSSSWTTLPQPLHHPFPPSQPPPPPPPPLSPPSLLSSHGGGFYKRVVEGLHNYNAYHEGTTIPPSTTHEPQHLGFPSGSSDPFRIQTDHESGDYKMSSSATTRETVDAKAVAASKSHSEAERRRRERINSHLTKLRTLLPNTTKTDKASLLAEVIQHLKDLKRQASIIAEQSLVPSEIDELTVNDTSDYEQGRMVIRASLCCEDRSDLLPDLIRTLKMLRLRTLKAEITTLGRRVKNVLFVTGEDHLSTTYNNDNQQMTMNHWINVVEDALNTIIEKANDRDQDSSKFASSKRQRTNEVHIHENRS